MEEGEVVMEIRHGEVGMGAGAVEKRQRNTVQRNTVDY